jgi:CRISPR-associated endonuclease/helicase Cas3
MNAEQYVSYFRYWGKVRKDQDGNLQSFHLLPYHCLDVAAVGHVLMRRQESWLRRIAGALPLNVADVRRFVLLFLALHDVGKFSSFFQGLVQELLLILQERTSARLYLHRHDGLGMALWDDELFSRVQQNGCFVCDSELAEDLPSYLAPAARASFGHHGYPVDPNGVSTSEQFTDDDIEAACDFVDACAALLLDDSILMPDDLGELYKALKIESWLLAGFVILCDWIGSNERLFPHCGDAIALEDYWHNACKLAERAVEVAGILSVPPMQFLGMGHLFPALREVTPSPLQAYVTECELPTGPQLWIIEDITGSGKTEAAMVLAHRLMQQGAEGVFVALPTMATANAMYERMVKAYRNLFSAEGQPSLALAHGRRNLMDGFTSTILDFEGSRLAEIPAQDSEEPTEASAACAEWIADNKKKVFLAHAGVGTIDQALLAVLPSKHHALRLFGITNKVLIVDEVHACDAYMAELLKALLQFHAAMGGSAILLSATIPQAMRSNFAAAFLKGMNLKGITQFAGAFPSVTTVSADNLVETPVAPREDLRRSLAVSLVHDKASVLTEIVNAAASGACVCWVRNTVADAVEAYESLTGESTPDIDHITLFHARYAMGHRLDREKDVLGRFGKCSQPDNRRGAVLIATQVVEQSLDLDFDFMISDLAPMDLLIQRAGRIHRHFREFRGNRRDPVLWVFSPPVTESPGPDWFSGFLEGASHVYEDHGHLWRTARLLKSRGGWTMPDHARELIEGVYGKEAEEIPDGLVKRGLEAEGKRSAEGAQGRFNALTVTAGYGGQQSAFFSDATAPTRLGEASVTFRLAIRSLDRILPMYDHARHAWMLSEVQVRESVIAKSAASGDEIQRAAVTMPDRGKWSELIVLQQETERLWRGAACDKKGKRIDLIYSLDTGLKVDKGGQ